MPKSRAFSLIEILVCMAIIAVLLSILLPALSKARGISYKALCSGNLKQIGVAWSLYLDDHGVFPRYTDQPDWNYGGASFVGAERKPVLALDRPINPYLSADQRNERQSLIYRCPADTGVFVRDGDEHRASILPGGKSAFEFFGNSYRANSILVGADPASADLRPMTIAEVDSMATTSRLLLVADSAWYYATRDEGHIDAQFEASWHGKTDAGNMTAVDGSVRWMQFTESNFDISPIVGSKPTGFSRNR